MKKGVCRKCGKVREVQNHHINGYSGNHKDEIAPYCRSCDLKAHQKARREGRCKLPSKITKQLSKNSYKRRTYRHILFTETMMPNVQLQEHLEYNETTGELTYSAYFNAYHGKNLKYMEE